ncbi:MAG: ABC transporter substrate-binding protein [Ktedonobacterales bacterium]
MDRGHVGYRLRIRGWMCARLCLLCCGLAIVLVGCDKSSAHPLSTAGPVPTVDADQVLRMALAPGETVQTLDPALQLDPDVSGILQLIWPTLVTLDSQEQPRPWAAQRINVSPDGLTYTFHLYPGLTFSDGTPIDAQAFGYSLNRLLDPCTGSQLGYYLYALKDAYAFNSETCQSGSNGTPTVNGSIKTLLNDAIFVQDPQTLILKLQQPAAYFLVALSSTPCAAVPAQLIARYGTQWTSNLAGGGGFGGNLFVVSTWDGSHSLVLRRNPRFWGKQSLLREIDFSVGQQAGATYTEYLGGQLDVGYAPASLYRPASERTDFHAVGDLTEDYFAMNWQIAPFNDLRMRQAFALALDKQSLVNQVFQGAALPTNHIVPDGVPGYNPSLTGPDGTATLAGNVVKAQQLEESYVHDTCNGQVDQCPAVTLTVASGYPDQAGLAQAALTMWKAALPGYPISVTTIDYATFLDDLIGNVATPTLQFWATSWVADYPDPQTWLSEQFLPSSAYNSGSVNLSAANALMIRADGEPDPDQRTVDYQRAEQLLVDQVAWIPLDQEKLWWESASYVVGYLIAANGQTPLSVWQTAYIARH